MSDIRVTAVPFNGADYDGYVAKMARVSHTQQPAKRSDSELVRRLTSDPEAPHWTPFAHIQYVYAIEVHQNGWDNTRLVDWALAKLWSDLAEASGGDLFDSAIVQRMEDKREIYIRVSLQHLLNVAKNWKKNGVLHRLLLVPHAAEASTSVALEEVARAGRALQAEGGDAIIQKADCTWFDDIRTLVTVLPAAYPFCSDPFPSNSVQSALLKETFRTMPELFTTTLLIENIPLWMATQLLRHRRGVVVNQQSFRYSSDTDYSSWKFDFSNWREQSKTKADAGRAPRIRWEDETMSSVRESCGEALFKLLKAYKAALEAGVSKECARDLLPAYFPTNMYVTLTREALDRIIHLRGGPEAQVEWAELVNLLRKVADKGQSDA